MRTRQSKSLSLLTIGTFGLFSLAPVQAGAQPPPASRLKIAHAPLECITTQALPVVEAAVAPAPDLAIGRVYFRAAQAGPDYYYVVLTGPAKQLEGLLPRPDPATKAVDYHLEAADKTSSISRTPGYAPKVIDDTKCERRRVAAVIPLAGAGLTIGLTRAGQTPYPPGFNKADIAKVILVSGAIVGAAAAAGAGTTAGGAAASTAGAAASGTTGAGSGAAAGPPAPPPPPPSGGISTGLLIGGGAAIAAGVVIAASSGGSSDNAPTPTFTPTTAPTQTSAPTAPTSTPTRTPTVTPTAALTATATNTPTRTPTGTTAPTPPPTNTPTWTPTPLLTATPTNTPTRTRTPTPTPTRTSTGTPTITPTSTPVPAALVFRVSWSGSAGCRDLNLTVFDPFAGALVPTTNVNQNCLSCVPSPFEEVSISKPSSGSTYRYNAQDVSARACACNAGAITVQFDVFKSGVIVQSNPSSSLCGSTTQSFSYTY